MFKHYMHKSGITYVNIIKRDWVQMMTYSNIHEGFMTQNSRSATNGSTLFFMLQSMCICGRYLGRMHHCGMSAAFIWCSFLPLACASSSDDRRTDRTSTRNTSFLPAFPPWYPTTRRPQIPLRFIRELNQSLVCSWTCPWLPAVSQQPIINGWEMMRLLGTLIARLSISVR